MDNVNTVKEIIKMVFIYNALEKGWTVKRGKICNTFEFTRLIGSSESLSTNYTGLRRCISEPNKLNLLG